MPKYNHDVDSMLFYYETTMKDGFRGGGDKYLAVERLVRADRTVYKEKPKCVRVRPPPLKETQTLMEWKTPNVPLELFVKPKEVVRTNPRKMQEPYVPMEDFDKERVRATRPRVVMTPAVSMDDIGDKRAVIKYRDFKLLFSSSQRELLTNDTYTTSAKSAMELGIATRDSRAIAVKAPLSGSFSPTNPLTIKQFEFPYITPEWRWDAAAWDARQLRGSCDPTRDFFLGRELRCEVCGNTAVRESNRARHKLSYNNTVIG